MNPKISHRIAARVAVIKLRSLLVADAYIALREREKLVNLAAGLIEQDEAASNFKVHLVGLIKARFGRNPDTFEVSDATSEALKLLDSLQSI